MIFLLQSVNLKCNGQNVSLHDRDKIWNKANEWHTRHKFTETYQKISLTRFSVVHEVEEECDTNSVTRDKTKDISLKTFNCLLSTNKPSNFCILKKLAHRNKSTERHDTSEPGKRFKVTNKSAGWEMCKVPTVCKATVKVWRQPEKWQWAPMYGKNRSAEPNRETTNPSSNSMAPTGRLATSKFINRLWYTEKSLCAMQVQIWCIDAIKVYASLGNSSPGEFLRLWKFWSSIWKFLKFINENFLKFHFFLITMVHN